MLEKQGVKKVADFPESVNAPVQCGCHVEALVSYCKWQEGLDWGLAEHFQHLDDSF